MMGWVGLQRSMGSGMAETREELTYALGAVARLVGISPDVLRAWERRYGAVSPVRTPGGTRRYRAADLERLRLLKAAVDAGHRIGEVATLDDAELERRGAEAKQSPAAGLHEVMTALEALDGAEAERLLAFQLSCLGPHRFARQLALPLLEQIGDEWQRKRLCVASEHLGSAILRDLLGVALRSAPRSQLAPSVLFATLEGERHELGLLIAAQTAASVGALPVFLGCDLPVDEIVQAAARTGADAVALGVTALPAADAEPLLRALREALPAEVELWVGGAGALPLSLPEGSVGLQSLDALEHRVALLHERSSQASRAVGGAS